MLLVGVMRLKKFINYFVFRYSPGVCVDEIVIFVLLIHNFNFERVSELKIIKSSFVYADENSVPLKKNDLSAPPSDMFVS